MIFIKKVSLVGLGFKTFVYKKFLWIYVGFSHFMKFYIPKDLVIICRKKKMYLYTVNKQMLSNFIRQLKYYNKPNRYKGKGLLEFKQFKGCISFRKGKK